MFVISKLVWILCQPLSLAFFFGLLALLAALLRRHRLGIVSSALSVSILFVTLFTSAGSVLIETLEDRFPRPVADPATLECMIVLGGGFATEVTTGRGGYDLNAAGDRFVEALRLAMKYPRSRVLISGGDGTITGHLEGDAIIGERMFTAFGIDKARLIEDRSSRTTYENAVNTRALLASNGLSNCLLITSGFHMPRAMGIFRKLDIPVVPWPVDYRSGGKDTLGLDATQPSLNSELLGIAGREWIGLAGYYLTGRTSALYPAP
ncbi:MULTISPECIES: YdcF family protein [Rhizobium]|uniref:YdcF family protein n=1 Tax=Rhizobium rhododendri TaxID=2506430 RepID=A0ABY8IEY2_9HYPH|nr:MULTISPECIES: YdcF family protein [Rhizobium]MBZ5762677.1 YdcF family protein [Rhizobium sp. VS19-DR96]MBZ5768639.1 YdcF family protein [Rhizobium sp. VS19-DR129.2]MBZ5776153.1 YdcF family protein [Rhizobium sp. VS19-DRK62.2]MBZ5787407.1 YdcF family protein [Rhizobium sp. VS19-DR121]MBZ5804695.1 YdcF family protein [Rhizobium sp. VS19-DR181]